MHDISVNQLVNNFQIIVVPMVSPEAVYNNESEVKAFGSMDPKTKREKLHETKGSISYPKTKLVRMDFGVIRDKDFDFENPKCFETNGSLFLAQLMQHHIFTVVLDLTEGTNSQITFPYGFKPDYEREESGNFC